MALKREIKEVEYKSLVGEVKDVDVKSGVITGYFASFNNVDFGRDKIMPGAFAKTILERGPHGTKQIKHIKQHDQNFPLGYINILLEDQKGLYFETKATQGVQYVEDVLRFYEAKVYNEHSIGYKAINWTLFENPDDEYDWHFELNEIKLYEGSTVLWGMNENTPFTGFKSQAEALKFLDDQSNTVLKGLRIDGLTDQSYKDLEHKHALITKAYRSIDSLILPKPLSAKGTSSEDKPDENARLLQEAREKGEQQTNEILHKLKTIFQK